MEPFRTVAPPLLSIGLLIFSLLLKPLWVAFWAIIYTSFSAAILLNPSTYTFFSNGLQIPEITSHCFRVIGLVSTAIFACWFSWILNRLRNKQEMITQLLLHMPMPVLVSDFDGVILLVNEKARKLLNISDLHPDKGLFFDLLAPKLQQGRCISDYLTIFNEGCSNNESLKLEIAGKPIKTHFELLNTSPRKLVTMIQIEN